MKIGDKVKFKISPTSPLIDGTIRYIYLDEQQYTIETPVGTAYTVPKNYVEPLPVSPLSAAFVVPKESKTLKLQPKEDMTLYSLISSARNYLNSNQEGYTRVEFKFENNYFVIAKLKER